MRELVAEQQKKHVASLDTFDNFDRFGKLIYFLIFRQSLLNVRLTSCMFLLGLYWFYHLLLQGSVLSIWVCFF